MNARRVVVIMPVYNEARHLQQVLYSISAQDFEHGRLYFVAVDGGSHDASADILKRWFECGDIEGRVLTNPLRKIPISLNIGLKCASDEDIVVRLDAHTVYGSRYLTQAIRALEAIAPDVGCVGGAQVPIPGTTFAHKIVEALYTNPMGLGGADFRHGDDIRDVDHVYLGAWRPGILQRTGGFNEALEANEDGEMSARVHRLGYRIVRVPLPCRFIINRGLWGSIRQWHRYGYWRSKMLQSNPDAIRRRHVVNPLAALLTTGLACSPLRWLLLPIFCVYALLIFHGRAKGESPLVTLATIAYFPVLQFAFAAGVFRGLLTGRERS